MGFPQFSPQPLSVTILYEIQPSFPRPPGRISAAFFCDLIDSSLRFNTWLTSLQFVPAAFERDATASDVLVLIFELAGLEEINARILLRTNIRFYL